MGRPRGQFEKNALKLLAVVDSLSLPDCWVSNEYLANYMGRSVRQVSRYVCWLVKQGLVERQLGKFRKAPGVVKSVRYLKKVQQGVRRGFGKLLDYLPARPKPEEPVRKEPAQPAVDVSGHLARLKAEVERTRGLVQRAVDRETRAVRQTTAHYIALAERFRQGNYTIEQGALAQFYCDQAERRSA